MLGDHVVQVGDVAEGEVPQAIAVGIEHVEVFGEEAVVGGGPHQLTATPIDSQQFVVARRFESYRHA